jgi:uncharacterized protein YnzC (UPF0291/DUF896 family)
VLPSHHRKAVKYNNIIKENKMSALTDRINELSRKSKTVGLTDEEKAEQARLRDEFRAIFRRNFGLQLENTKFVDENGNEVHVPKKQKKD